MYVACCSVFAVWCMLCVGSCVLRVAVLFVVMCCCVLFLVCLSSLRVVGCCLLIVVCAVRRSLIAVGRVIRCLMLVCCLLFAV